MRYQMHRKRHMIGARCIFLHIVYHVYFHTLCARLWARNGKSTYICYIISSTRHFVDVKWEGNTQRHRGWQRDTHRWNLYPRFCHAVFENNLSYSLALLLYYCLMAFQRWVVFACFISEKLASNCYVFHLLYARCVCVAKSFVRWNDTELWIMAGDEVCVTLRRLIKTTSEMCWGKQVSIFCLVLEI